MKSISLIAVVNKRESECSKVSVCGSLLSFVNGSGKPLDLIARSER